MNKYHLLWVIERLQGQWKDEYKPEHPTWQDVCIPLALFIGCLLALVPGDFKDFMGLEAASWKAIAVGGAGISGGATVVMAVMWSYLKIQRPRVSPKSAEEIVNQIIYQMDEDRKRLAK